MVNTHFRRLLTLSTVTSVLLLSLFARAQDTEKRGRKYNPPPATAHVSVAVVKDTNGKPIENAAVIFHMEGEEGKGNMELKTNGEGKASIDVIPIGDTMRLQVFATGYQTFGEDYKIDTDSKDLVVRMRRPGRQYSTYEHAETGGKPVSTPPPGDQKSSDTQAAPKQ